MHRLALFAVLALALLAACAPTVAQAPTVTSEPPTLTATAEPTSTATATSTLTPTPTETPLPSPTPLSDAFLSGQAAEEEYTIYLLEQMARAREEGEETFTSYTPHGHEVEVDVVPAEVAEQFEWDWGVVGFVKEEEGKNLAYREAYQDAPDGVEKSYIEVGNWREYREVEVELYGEKVSVTIESSNFAALQESGMVSLEGRFTDAAAVKLQTALEMMYEGDASKSVMVVPALQDAVKEFTEAGEPAEYIRKQHLRESGISIVIEAREVVHEDDVTWAYTVLEDIGRSERWGFDVRNGRLIVRMTPGTLLGASDTLLVNYSNLMALGLIKVALREHDRRSFIEDTYLYRSQDFLINRGNAGEPGGTDKEILEVYEKVIGDSRETHPLSNLIFY